jgi:hypothetical protein
VESAAALVWTNCRVELDSVTTVYANLTFIVDPWNTEDNLTLWLKELLKYLDVFGVLFENNC